MKKELLIIVSITLLTIFSVSIFAAEEHLLPLQGTAKLNGVSLSSGNIIVEIYDAPTGGNLVYNSTNDFLNIISGGKYDIILGNGTQPLSLNFGTKYYMDMYMNGVDLDFNSSERQVFMSTVGNISISSPLKITSDDVDDALNVSAGGAYFGGNVSVNNSIILSDSGNATISKQLIVQSTDPDDALNVSAGGLFVSKNITTFAYLAIRSTDPDDALNVSSGGLYVSRNATIDGFLWIKSTKFLDALNVSNGGAYINKNLTVGQQAIIESSDADDALNVTTGSVVIFEGNMSIGNPDSVNQHHLDVYDGGTNKCSYLTLYDEGGSPHYLFVNATNGNLLIGISVPTNCDEADGQAVGAQT